MTDSSYYFKGLIVFYHLGLLCVYVDVRYVLFLKMNKRIVVDYGDVIDVVE